MKQFKMNQKEKDLKFEETLVLGLVYIFAIFAVLFCIFQLFGITLI